jgi:hypothetical protein
MWTQSVDVHRRWSQQILSHRTGPHRTQPRTAFPRVHFPALTARRAFYPFNSGLYTPFCSAALPAETRFALRPASREASSCRSASSLFQDFCSGRCKRNASILPKLFPAFAAGRRTRNASILAKLCPDFAVGNARETLRSFQNLFPYFAPSEARETHQSFQKL